MVYLQFFILNFQNFFSKEKVSHQESFRSRDSLFLEEHILCKEPISLLTKWYEEAKQIPNIIMPNVGSLVTCTKDGTPSGRTMLMRDINSDGLIFCTSYSSRKGREIEENPKACFMIYWEAHARAIRVEGNMVKMAPEISDEYWKEASYDAQVQTVAGIQSEVVESRKAMEDKAKDLKCRYGGGTVSRPPQWGGYILKPTMVEFWQGQSDRLHDRIRFRVLDKNEKIDGLFVKPGSGGWVYERLWP